MVSNLYRREQSFHRITEWLTLEGILEITYSNLPTMGRAASQLDLAAQDLTNLALNIPRLYFCFSQQSI